MVAPRGVTPEDEALFKTIRAEFCRRITAEGCHTQIRAVESDGDDYTMYIVAQGISWTVKFELTEEKTVDLFTIEKTKKKKSCTIL